MQVNRIMQDTYMDVTGRTTHMYRKYGIRVTQDAVTEETKSSYYREILIARIDLSHSFEMTQVYG